MNTQLTPSLKFYMKKLSEKELAEANEYEAPSRESYELLANLEPTKAAPTYEIMLQNYDKCFEEREKRGLAAVQYTIEKIIISGPDDESIKKTEQSPGFVQWVSE